MSLDALIAQLLVRTGRGAKLGLDTVRAALARLDNPHRDLRMVHVAGTNGKGSTCAMVESIARAAGLRTGLYSSPHLERFNERIQIDGKPIDDNVFARILQPLLGEGFEPLSFFEVLTVAALVAMKEAHVQLAILEVGLGGRLDATNVVDRPLCTAITSIGIDHTSFLGDDIADIAREKAGIAKVGVPLVLGPVEGRARTAIQQIAATTGSPVEEVSRADLDDATKRALTSTLGGAHQHDNAAVALTIAKHALPALGAIDWQQHATAALAATRWPGRLESIVRDEDEGVSEWLLDCAHNLAALDAIEPALDRLSPEPAVLVYGAMRDKPWREMLSRLALRKSYRIYAPAIEPIAGREAVSPEELAEVASGMCAPSPAAAVELARRHAGGHMVLVTGSIFLVGAVRAVLLGEKRDVAVPL